MSDYKELDAAIMSVLGERKNEMTYVIGNVVRRINKLKTTKTALILRRLKAFEKLGTVKRVKSNYTRQLCWTAP